MCVGLLACLSIGRSLLSSLIYYSTPTSSLLTPHPRPHDNSNSNLTTVILSSSSLHHTPSTPSPHSRPRAPVVAPSLPPPTKTSITPSWYVHATSFPASRPLKLRKPPSVRDSQPSLDFGLPSLSIAQPHLSTVTYKGRRQQIPFTCTLLSPTIKSHLLVSIAPHSTPR
jgi:hypothetical protein